MIFTKYLDDLNLTRVSFYSIYLILSKRKHVLILNITYDILNNKILQKILQRNDSVDLNQIYTFSKEKLQNDRTGHDWLHALRVEKNALDICPKNLSKSEQSIIQASIWLHDIIDPKISPSQKTSITEIKTLLNQANANEKEKEEILHIIQNISYSKNIEKKQSLSLLGQIVQDADRLDALGAIGIARTFYYGGSQNHSLYNGQPARKIDELTEENYRKENSVINHFYEKLLHLESEMNTEIGKEMARERTHFMKTFLTHFDQETAIDF